MGMLFFIYWLLNVVLFKWHVVGWNSRPCIQMSLHICELNWFNDICYLVMSILICFMYWKLEFCWYVKFEKPVAVSTISLACVLGFCVDLEWNCSVIIIWISKNCWIRCSKHIFGDWEMITIIFGNKNWRRGRELHFLLCILCKVSYVIQQVEYL